VLELVETVARLGEAHGAAAVQSDWLARPLLEPLVQIEAAFEEPHRVRARDELRAQAGRVPGRA
jgi:hypothetical protein